MAETKYTVVQTTLDGVGYENFTEQDRSVVDSFEINSAFDESKDTIELHIYGLDGTLLDSNLNYRGAQQLQGAENGANLTIDPERDALAAGYDQGGVKLLYNFLSSISPEEFFIQEISADRTELRVLPVSPTFDSTDLVAQIKEIINKGAYYSEYRLNFGGNDLLIGINIDLNNSILIKLYEPLPPQYSTRARFTFDEIVSDSVVFEVEAEFIPDAPVYPTLRGANFNIDTGEEKVQPTEYLSYSQLYSYPVTSSLHGVISQLSASGIDLSIDFTEYTNFVHFSSAEQRLKNFNSKMVSLEAYNYSASISTVYKPQYDNLTKGIIANFDEYEKYLYFDSSSKAWPKVNSLRPYENDTVANASDWYTSQLATASLYDELNESRLVYTVPEFIREDNSNEPYTRFLDMIGQHFDSLWVYSKAMTDKYDADNRLDVGVSKDLIRDVLKSFGVKLYSSNFSISNLAASYIGEFYQSGSELINSFVTASNQPTPDKDLLAETYKRIYHNLPYLIKTKGTERGLRALINCFGIPSGSLSIEVYGGTDRTAESYFAYEYPTENKIRLDNTGSIVSGDTLSQYTSIQKPSENYNQDLHTIEVGFSPSKHINEYILTQLPGNYVSPANYVSPNQGTLAYVLNRTLHIDQYIGDPRNQNASEYIDLDLVTEAILSGSNRYDIQDFVRLTKFYDNQVFKMIKDFVPARSNVNTGIVIKPHMLDRSKVKTPVPVWTRPEYSASIDTAFTSGSEGGVIPSTLNTSYTASFSSLTGSVNKVIKDNSPIYNGELGGSELTVTTQNLNLANTYKSSNQPDITFDIQRTIDTVIKPIGYVDTFPETEPSVEKFIVRYLERELGGIPIQYEYDLLDGTIHKTTSNSINLDGDLNNITEVYVLGRTFVVTEVQEFSNHYYLKFKKQINVSRVPVTSDAAVVFKNYVDKLFYNSEYNVLINNAVESELSRKFTTVDRTTGIEPQNLGYILSTTASGADIQDTNYDSLAYTNIRYNGVEHTSPGLNSINTVTGLIPVETPQTYFGYFSYLGGTSPEWGNHIADRTGAKLQFLIGLDGKVVTPSEDAEGINLSIIRQNFIEGQPSVVSQDSVTNSAFNNLNGPHTTFKSGKRIEPILYSQTASYDINDNVDEFGYSNRITFFSTDVQNSNVSSDMSFSARAASNQVISNTTVPFTIELFDTKTGPHASYNSSGDYAVLDPADQDQPFIISIDAQLRSLQRKTYRFDVTYEIQKSTSGITWVTLDSQTINHQDTRYYSASIQDSITDTSGNDTFLYRLRVTALDKHPFATNVELDSGLSFLKISQSPKSATSNVASSSYWEIDSNDRSYISASRNLSKFYGDTQNDIEDSGFNVINHPFKPVVGDEIRFEASENYSFRIDEIVKEQPQLILKLSNTVPSGVNQDFFLVRRYVDDPTSIILEVDKKAGATSAGVIKPAHMPTGSDARIETILQKLINSR